MPEIFNILSGTTPGHGGEIQLTDALLALSKKRNMYAYEFEGTRYDAGDKFGYLQAIVACALRHDELGEPFKEYLKDICDTL
jgi:UTP--glucose-1-phosphate uridylyltransferase